MIRSSLRSSALGWLALGALGCSLGGQTYDDGSDEVRTRPSESLDAGSKGPGPAAGGGTSEPEPGREPEPDAGGAGPSCDDRTAEVHAAIDALVDDADVACDVDADCVQVGTAPSCVDSCHMTAVVSDTGADAIESGLAELDATLCEDFSEAGCTFFPSGCPMDSIQREPRCEAGGCALVEVPEPVDCFGPEQNLDQAYSETLSGCPCDDVGGLCDGSVALICSGGEWRAVEDGPCEPGVRDQACDGRLESAERCVALFDTCFDLSTGLFCGVGRRTSRCVDGELVEDQNGCLQDDAFCVEQADGLYCTGGAPSGESWTLEECTGRGGEVVSDEGGELAECPDGRATLAKVDECIEDCWCCGIAP